MPLILYRYFLREQTIPVGLCLVGMIFVMITGRLFQLTRYLFTSSVTFSDIVEVMAYIIPQMALYALPMAAFLGVQLAFVRLNGDNELIALRTAGISFRQFFPPVAIMLTTVTLLAMWNSLLILPLANHALENKLKSLGKASIPVLLQEGLFITTIPRLTFFFQRVDTATLDIEGVFIQDQRNPSVKATIVAETARIISQKQASQLVFKLHNGVITRIPEDYKDSQMVSFKDYDLVLSLDEIFGGAKNQSKSRFEMTMRDLLHAIRHGGGESYESYALEFHQRIALPLSCLLLGFIAPPLGALFHRKSRLAGISTGVIVFLVYYLSLLAGRALGENRLMPPLWAVWTSNFLCTCAALWLWTKVQTETPWRIIRFRGIRHPGLQPCAPAHAPEIMPTSGESSCKRKRRSR